MRQREFEQNPNQLRGFSLAADCFVQALKGEIWSAVKRVSQKIRISTLLALVLLIAASAISIPLSYSQGAARNQHPRENPNAGKVEGDNQAVQAISVLHDVVDNGDRVTSLSLQGTLISGALDLLWKREQPYARFNFQKALDRFFLEYSSKTITKEQRNQVAVGIKTVISHLAKHDPAAGTTALNQYEKLTEELSQKSENLSLKDRLAVAQSSLDVDARQSAMLAARLLDAGVPTTFPDYLYQLEIQDEDLATDLYRAALSHLAGNPAYTPVHATILSAYAFREKLLVLEIRSNSKSAPHIEFGSFATSLSPRQKAFNSELASAYLSTAYRFLEQRLIVLQPQTELDQEYLIQCYFLAKKLSRYALRLNLNDGGRWQQLGNYYELLGQRAGLTIEELGSVARLAERLVAEGSIFQFDDGDSAFEKAKLSKDPQEKTALLVRGIHELMEAGKFAEAEQKIGELNDDAIVSRMMDYLHFRVGRAAIRKRKWQDVDNISRKIIDSRLQTYLLLEGADAALKNAKKDLASDYLQSAMSTASRIDDKASKAKALVALAGLIASLNAEWNSQALLDATKAINQADSYDGEDYSITIELPKLKLFFPLENSDINTCFERSAKTDWVRTISATNAIGRSDIRAMAQIAACRTVL